MASRASDLADREQFVPQQKVQQPKQPELIHNDSGIRPAAPEAPLIVDPTFKGRGITPIRIASTQRVQRTFGNRFLQNLIRKPDGKVASPPGQTTATLTGTHRPIPATGLNVPHAIIAAPKPEGLDQRVNSRSTEHPTQESFEEGPTESTAELLASAVAEFERSAESYRSVLLESGKTTKATIAADAKTQQAKAQRNFTSDSKQLQDLFARSIRQVDESTRRQKR